MAEEGRNREERLLHIDKTLARSMRRRDFLRYTAYGTASAALTAFLAACGISASPSPSTNASTGASAGPLGRALKIGYVTPSTGALAPFGAADGYTLSGVTQLFGPGLVNNGTTHPVEVITKDSQSDPARAAEVANELITDDQVDLVLVSSTPETTNPVADVCEANGVPCVSTVAPWQPYFFGRQPTVAPPDAQPFEWTYHFFWGLEDIIAVFLEMWDQVPTNKTVGALWPNDGDGNAWSSPEVGFPPALEKAGYTLVDPGRYENLSSDFTAQITAFKNAGVEIVTGVMIPPDFPTFWSQAAQQGFVPKIVSVGKALLFPAAIEALGDNNEGDGLSSEVWWSPSHPFTSSLTDQTAEQLASGFTDASGQQWTQPIGFAHALFEVAADVFARATDLDDPASIRDAIVATSLETIVGHIEWTGTPTPNVAKTPLVGGQWVTGSDYPYDLVLVSNEGQPDIPTTATLEPIPGS